MTTIPEIGQNFRVFKEDTSITLTNRKKGKDVFKYKTIFQITPFNIKEVALHLEQDVTKICIELYEEPSITEYKPKDEVKKSKKATTEAENNTENQL